jgi:hypothetical protein
MRTFLLLLSLCTLLLSGCTRQLIPNTDVENTPENRKIIQFCEDYRRAVERREIGILFSLAHPKYYEDGGNIDASDDIDHAGLKDFLRERFSGTRAIRYEIRYRRVKYGPNDTVFVDYTYSASYKIPTDEDEDGWHRQVADNRLELTPHKDTFLILSGM